MISVQNIIELGKLKGLSDHVKICEVLVEEKRVKLFGKPEGCKQAKIKIDSILVGWLLP